jgi:hypothetical protein
MGVEGGSEVSDTTGPCDPNIEHLGSVYCGIMDVVADRLDAIVQAIAEVEANPNHPNNWRNAEFAYLQIRKCVEYVALALLAAHRATNYECEKIENAYKADVIFNDLGRVYPHGFPKAINIELNNQSPGQHHIDQRPTLSKRRMKRIYDGCALHLHAGTLTDIINQTVPPYDLARVAAWHKELESLLRQHQVMLPHVGLLMAVWLKEPESLSSRVAFAQAEGPFQIEGDAAIYNEVNCE